MLRNSKCVKVLNDMIIESQEFQIRKQNIILYFAYRKCCFPTEEELQAMIIGKLSPEKFDKDRGHLEHAKRDRDKEAKADA